MKIGVVGCAGRMGRMLVQTIAATDGVVLVGGTEQPGHPAIGADVGLQSGASACGVSVGDDPQRLFAEADAVIDFTVQAVARRHAELAARHKAALVIGTTGLEPDDQAAIASAARVVPVVQAANMSVGVNLLLGLTEQVAARLGDDYDIEIVEMHHRHKVDAPSGTALALGRAAAAGRGTSLDSVAQRVRDGRIGARRQGDIGFATLRGGDVVGEHTVIFASDGERIEITHRATARTIFARGAVRAALWTRAQPPGLYSMRQVLGLD
ncbi:MAG: 4-hydroxy-tetrahydrodipicolinate reductase [Rhodospirillales bacterium]|nr:4-hydroxy-tetrahydrodipicolinate reductase [Rhodospirillales bacterium]